MANKAPPVLVALLASLMVVWPGRSSAEITLADLHANIVAKFLAFDQNLSARCPGGVVIGVVTDAATQDQRDRVVHAFAALSRQAVSGKSVRVLSVVYSSPGKLADAVRAGKVNTLFLTSGAKPTTAEALAELGSKQRIPTFGGSRALAEKGLAVGVAVQDGKLKLVINLKALRAQGLKISAEVLALADVIN